MKILHIVSSYYPAFRFGGPIHAVHNLNKSIVNNGHSIDVLATNAGIDDHQNIFIDKWTDLDGMRVMYKSFWGYEHFNFSLSYVRELIRIIKFYDLIHITGIWNFPILAGSLCAIFFNKPFIISPRGSLYEETVNLKRSRVKKIYLKLFGRFFLKKASVIHYTSMDEYQKVEKFLNLKNKSIIIPNGIDLNSIQQFKNNELFRKRFPELTSRKYILSLGRITKKKGFDLLIPAMKKIVEDRNDLLLVIAGPDDEGYSTEVKKMINENNLERNVVFTGLLDGELKWSAYRNAEIFVLPSYSENFGNTIVEAMACGTPVVVTDKVGISKELDENESGIVVETDVDSLYRGVDLLLTDKKLRERITINAESMIRKFFDIECVTSQMIDSYNQILNARI